MSDTKRITAEELDRIFDEGEEDIVQYLDHESGIHINRPRQRVNVDFPTWMVLALDEEARRVGVTRQSVIKMWIAQRLDRRARAYRRLAAAADEAASEDLDEQQVNEEP